MAQARAYGANNKAKRDPSLLLPGKILLSILLATLALAQADYPLSDGHRYHPTFKKRYSLSLESIKNPQLKYGPPTKIIQSASSIPLPGGVTVEDLIRLTEKLQNEKYHNGFQSIRGSKIQQFIKPPPPPLETYQQPLVAYKTIAEESTTQNTQWSPPKTSYGVPIEPQKNIYKPQNQYGVPPKDSYGVPIQPQPQYGVPDKFVQQVSDKYQTLPSPNQANKFWNINNNNNHNNNNNIGWSGQHLPVKEAVEFKPSVNINHQQFGPPVQNFNSGTPNKPVISQYLPVGDTSIHNNFKGDTQNKPAIPQNVPAFNPSNFGVAANHPQSHFNTQSNNKNNVNNVNQQMFNFENNPDIGSQSPYINTQFAQIPNQQNSFNKQPNVFTNNQPNQNTGRYLPPVATTTARNVYPQVATEKPVESSTEAVTEPNQADNKNQLTESPLTTVNNEDPNISIANAVAGVDPSLFYLQQADGRLQKVILQKTPDPSGNPEEYTAEYYFQNFEGLPNTVYSPLISLG